MLLLCCSYAALMLLLFGMGLTTDLQRTCNGPTAYLVKMKPNKQNILN